MGNQKMALDSYSPIVARLERIGIKSSGELLAATPTGKEIKRALVVIILARTP